MAHARNLEAGVQGPTGATWSRGVGRLLSMCKALGLIPSTRKGTDITLINKKQGNTDPSTQHSLIYNYKIQKPLIKKKWHKHVL